MKTVKNLLTKLVDLVAWKLALIGNRQQREALIHIRLGDDFAVDDCGRLDDRRHGLAEDLGIVGQPQRAGAAGGWGRVCRILRRCCSRYGQYERRCCITSAGREEFGCCGQVRKSLVVQSNERISVYSAPLNAGLAAEPLERHPEREGASFAEPANSLIVPPPRDAKRNALILVIDAKAVPNRLESVRNG